MSSTRPGSSTPVSTIRSYSSTVIRWSRRVLEGGGDELFRRVDAIVAMGLLRGRIARPCPQHLDRVARKAAIPRATPGVNGWTPRRPFDRSQEPDLANSGRPSVASRSPLGGRTKPAEASSTGSRPSAAGKDRRRGPNRSPEPAVASPVVLGAWVTARDPLRSAPASLVGSPGAGEPAAGAAESVVPLSQPIAGSRTGSRRAKKRRFIRTSLSDVGAETGGMGRSAVRVGAAGRPVPPQYASELTTSPTLRVPRAHHVCGAIEFLMKWTEPSANAQLTPPGWYAAGAGAPDGVT